VALDIGSRVGAYQITALIGEGGMGRVFRARDATLERDVALKVLPELVAADPERRARFEREARTLASVNHPHIAHVYGFEQSSTTSVLVMELVEGEDLAQRVERGRIDIDEALPIARQIAEAIEAAHEMGIVHRDLKPANIKLRADGTIKVLDFGLAKAIDAGIAGTSSSGAPAVTSPTITSPAMTMQGVILGTAAYMSPEQARGRPADKRSDIWAYGCVLYEMLTGVRAFEGDEVSDTLAAVLRAEPDWSRLAAETPAGVRRLLRRCLEKDRRNRLPDIAVARFDIDEAIAGPEPPAQLQRPPVRLRRTRQAAIVAGVALLTSAVTALVVWRAAAPGPMPLRPVQRFTFPTPPGAPYTGGDRNDIAVARDGTRFAYSTERAGGTRVLILQPLDRTVSRALTSGGISLDPFFSPDGEWIAFFRLPDGLGSRGTLNKVSVRGGPAIEICEAGNPFGGVWADDGTIVFATADVRGPTAESSLFRVSASGGIPQRIHVALQGSDRIGLQAWPDVLPGGRGILYSARRELREDSHIVLVASDNAPRTIIDHGSHARYVSSGHIVYVVGNTVMAVPFDLDRLATSGGPVPLVEGIATSQRGNAAFAVSPSGFLMYATGGATFVTAPKTLVWVDRRGHEEPFGLPRQYVYPRISPDGTRIALDIREGFSGRAGRTSADIWIWDIARKNLAPLTTDPGDDQYPVWTPDSKRILFSSIGGNRPGGIYWQAADGTGQAERVIERSQADAPYSFTPDASQFVFRDTQPQTSDDIVVVTMPQRNGGETTPARLAPLIHSPFAENNAEISPDGRWIAYQSNESSRDDIYVRPFPNVDASRTLVSGDGGTRPLWSRDGRELFYVRGTSPDPVQLYRVPVRLAPGFSAGTPQLLFEGAYYAIASPAARGRTYDLMPDGKRFVFIKESKPQSASIEPAGSGTFEVVLNFLDELRRVAPVQAK
jgi:serine/threonine-protein kinase